LKHTIKTINLKAPVERKMFNANTLSAMAALLLAGVTVVPCTAQVPAVTGPARDIGVLRTGSVQGQAVDARTQSPLPGVSVSIPIMERVTRTGADGRFVMDGVPVGSFVLEFRSIGYRPTAVSDVIVKPNRITYADAPLEPVPVELESIVVMSGYFPKEESQPTSIIGFSGEEIRRAPGSAGDVSRIMASLPSVAKVNDQTNSLIVRGGSPIENSFYVDNIQIPNINHFPTQGASGGPIGLLNVDFIKDVDFKTGGFSAAYGDRLSSVMDIGFRDGNRSEVDGQVDMNLAGFGGVAEGPLGGRGSWLLSARRSYLDLLIKMVDVGSTVAPRYSDYQGKVSLDLGKGHKLTILGVGAEDRMTSDSSVAVENAMIVFGNQDLRQGTVGTNWRALWGGGISNTSLSYTGSRFMEDYYETTTGNHLFQNRSLENAFTLRNVNTMPLGSSHSIDFGIEAKHYVIHYDNYYAEYTDALGELTPELVVDERVGESKLSAFGSYTVRPWARLALNLGVRADHFTFSDNSYLSPRASLSYRLTDRTSLTAATGVYYQSLPAILLAQTEENRDLHDPRAIHYIIGLTHMLSDHTQLTVEAYHKDYDFFPVNPAQPSLFVIDELFYRYGFFMNHEQLVDEGQARTSGIEASIQKRLARDVYGLLTAAYFRSEYAGGDDVWRDRVFDNRVVLSAEGGYKPNSSWEFSARWIYAGGPPYTPLDLEQSSALNRGVLDGSRINGARYPDYHSLNVRFDRRFNFSGSNMIVYLSVWNAYNRKNVANYYWNEVEGRQDRSYQWSALPIFGVEYEF
jgi:hypothetical protein